MNTWMHAQTTSIALLKQCRTAGGFTAAAEDRENYGRVWARDGCICGLAALVSDDEDLLAAFAATLRTLVRHQGAYGQIPSNVDEARQRVSYGTDVGRIDPTIWFLIGACAFGRMTGDDSLVEEFWEQLDKAHHILCAWEVNNSGLLYIPQGGDWADQLILSGYLLYDHILRLWAMRELRAAAQRLNKESQAVSQKARQIEQVLVERFRPDDRRPYFLAGYRPGSTFSQFDAFGNALCCLTAVGERDERLRCLDYAAGISERQLVPAFFPAIEEDDPRYQEIRHLAELRHLDHPRNTPWRYQNGGLWPMITGFWALAARCHGNQALADHWVAGIVEANRAGEHGFYEYLDARTGEPGGARTQAWSAAATLLATVEKARQIFP